MARAELSPLCFLKCLLLICRSMLYGRFYMVAQGYDDIKIAIGDMVVFCMRQCRQILPMLRFLVELGGNYDCIYN